MIITISGKPAAGKSTTAKALAKKLELEHHSGGDLQRELAKELGLTINELGNLEAQDEKYDRMIDEKLRKLGETKDNFVIDGWLSAHFIPNSIKIFLEVDIDEAVRRRIKQPRKEETYTSAQETKQKFIEREKVNRDRWIKYYNFDYSDSKNYDLVIDTTNVTSEQVVEKIMTFIKTKQ